MNKTSLLAATALLAVACGATPEIRVNNQEIKVGDGLFPDLEQQVKDFARERDRVESFAQTVDSIRDRFADASNLGGLKS